MRETKTLLEDHRWRLVSAGAGAIGILLMALVLLPQTMSLVGDTREWLQSRQSLRVSDGRLIETDRIAIQDRALRARLAGLAVTADNSDSPAVLSELQASAQRSGLVLNRIEPQVPDTSGTVESTLFELELSGDFHELGQFLVDLESSPVPVRVRYLEIASSSARNFTLDVQAHLNTYRFLSPTRTN